MKQDILGEGLGGEYGEDGALWAELSHCDGLLTRVRKKNDEFGAKHVRCRDGTVAHRLLNTHSFPLLKQDRLLDVVFNLVVLILFSFEADLRHVLRGFLPVWSEGGLTCQD